MGVWIETCHTCEGQQAKSRHTLYGCVDWNSLMPLRLIWLIWSHPVWVCGLKHNNKVYVCHLLSHTLYGCVDWNFICSRRMAASSCHTLYGCVDWNFVGLIISISFPVTPCMGVWIETSRLVVISPASSVTPCMGVWIETVQWFSGSNCLPVTPCMGVWIETSIPPRYSAVYASHPVWVCGLKPHINI